MNQTDHTTTPNVPATRPTDRQKAGWSGIVAVTVAAPSGCWSRSTTLNTGLVGAPLPPLRPEPTQSSGAAQRWLWLIHTGWGLMDRQCGAFGKKESALARARLLASACSVCFCLTAAAAWGQGTNPGPSQPMPGGQAVPTPSAMPIAVSSPAEALQQGISNYKKGDYEAAARYLSAAKQSENRLSPANQQTLQEYMDLTGKGLTERSRALAELAEAENLVRAGKTDQADALLQRVLATRGLNPTDRQRAEQLNSQLRQGQGNPFSRWFSRTQESDPKAAASASPNPMAVDPNTPMLGVAPGQVPGSAALPMAASAPTPMPTADTKLTKAAATELVRNGRKLLEANQFDEAERFAQKAKEYTGNWFFSDNPERLLRDIAKARSATGSSAAPTGPEAQNGTVPMPAAMPVPMPTQMAGNTNPETIGKQQVLSVLDEARRQMAYGNFARATALANSTKAIPVQWSATDRDTPDRVLADIQQSQNYAQVVKPQPVTPTVSGPIPVAGVPMPTAVTTAPVPNPVPNSVPMTASIPTAAPSMSMPPAMQWPDAPPPLQAAVPTPTPTVDPAYLARKQQADQLLHQARMAEAAGDLAKMIAFAKEAEKLGVQYASYEDSPQKIYSAFTALQAHREESRRPAQTDQKRQEAIGLLTQAKTKADQGQFDQALQLVQQADKMRVSYSAEDPTPTQVLTTIMMQKEQAQRFAAAQSDIRTVGAEQDLTMPSHGPTPAMHTNQSGMGPGKGVSPVNQPPQVGRASVADNGTPNKTVAVAPPVNSTSNESASSAASAKDAYEVGLSALQRKDYARAYQMLALAARQPEQLTKEQQRHLQEIMPDLRSKMAGADKLGAVQPVSASANQTSGTASATDQHQAMFANYQLGDGPLDDPAGPTGLEGDLLSDAARLDQVELQRLRAVTIRAMMQAANELKTDPERALETLSAALEIVQTSRLSRDALAPLETQLQQRIRLYRNTRNQLDLEELEANRSAAIAERRRREDFIIINNQNRIKQLSNEFNDLLDVGLYRQAEATAQRIIEIDPNELFGYAALSKARLSRKYAIINNIEDRKTEAWWETLRQVEESAIPFPDEPPIVYMDAKDWEELSIRRIERYSSVDLAEKSEKTKEIEKKLSQPVTFDFNETPLTEVVNFLRQITGVNIILDKQGLDLVGITPEDTFITMSLNGVSLKSALRLILKDYELTYLVRDEVLLITDEEGTAAELVTKVYPVADLVIPIQNFQGGAGGIGGGFGGGGGGGGFGGGGFGGGGFGGGGFGGGGLGGGGFGGGGFGGAGANAEPGSNSAHSNSPEEHAAKETNKKLNEIKDLLVQSNSGGLGGGAGGNIDIAPEVIDLIQNTIEPDAWEDNGGESRIEYFQPNRSFVITTTPRIHEKVADLLTQLRRLQDLQVTVEVRFITVDDQFFERIGIDFDVSIDSNNDNYIRNVSNNLLQPLGSLPIPGAGVTYINQAGLNSGNHERGVTFGLDPDGTATSNFNIPIQQSSFDVASIPLVAGLDPLLQTGGGSVAGGTSFGIAFLNDIDVFLVLEAVTGSRRSTTMTAPKVTLFNGQFATVFVGRTVPFVTDVTPIVSAGAVAFDPTITQLFEGTTLTVQAVISADRRYVRLNLLPFILQLESLDQVRTINVGAAAGGGGGLGGAAGSATATIQLPIQNITTVNTTVTVPDGGTVLLGGLKTHSEARNEFGTPVLSRIPYLNRLFRNAATSRASNSLMLMVTPRIIILEEEEEKIGFVPYSAF